MTKDKIYKPKEFAEVVGVSVRTLQRWDNDGTFPAKRTPSGRRYYLDYHIRRFNTLNEVESWEEEGYFSEKDILDIVEGLGLDSVVVEEFKRRLAERRSKV